MRVMRVTTIHAARDIRLEERPEPTIGAPTDAVVKVAAGCICGSDLWPYRGENDITRDVARAHLAGYRVLFEEILTAQGIHAPEALARQLVLLLEGATTVSAIDSHAQPARDAKTAAQSLVAMAHAR